MMSGTPEGIETEHVASRLRAAREVAGKTQQEAADRIGASRTTVVAIEKGERPIRSGELVSLAEYFGKSVNELLRPNPMTEDFVAEFRSSADREMADSEVLEAVSRLQDLADDYVELERRRWRGFSCSRAKSARTRRWPTPRITSTT